MKFEGKHAVYEFLTSGKTVEKVLIANGLKGAEDIIDIAKRRGIKVVYASRSVLDAESETGTHQGIIGYGSDFTYGTISDSIKLAEKKGEDLFFIILDGIEDPHNLGSIIRTAECAGVHGVIIPKHRAVSVTETVVRTSAGAAGHMNIIKCTNINAAISELKDKGVFVYAADMGGVSMYKANLKGKIAVVVGGENKGVSELTKKLCDEVVAIPMFGKINSLNASVSAAVVLYEVVRQRGL